MMRGPSPVIPFLLVGALSLFVCRERLMIGYEFVAALQDVTIALLVIVIVPLLLLVGTMTEFIIVPLAFLLLVFLLRNVLVASLLLMLSAHAIAKICHSSSWKPSVWEQQPDSRDDEDGTGLHLFVFILFCFIICLWFYEVDGHGWISLVFGVAFILYFNMF